MRCLFITQELAPHFTEGGLGLSSTALPPAIQRCIDVEYTVILPFYPWLVRRAGLQVVRIAEFPALRLGRRFEPASIYRAPELGQGNEVLLVRSDAWYERGGGIYRDDDYVEYADARARSAFFGWTVFRWLNRQPRRYELIHGNDWQSGMAQFLIARDRQVRSLQTPALLYEIHSGFVGGKLPADSLEETLGLDQSGLTAVRQISNGQPSMKVLAMFSADALVTCSRTYARELSQFFAGTPLAVPLSRLGITGIVSGVDYEHWNPSQPHGLAEPYTAQQVDTAKPRNKLRLQQHFGLRVDPRAPVFCICSRLVPEKGMDLLVEVLPEILRQSCAQVVVMGAGDRIYREAFAQLATDYPAALIYRPAFDLPEARLLYAGSDFTLMPSLLEPCGLNQLIAMRYGTIPVVSPVGGLHDTVPSLLEDPDHGSGFVLEQCTADALRVAIRQSIAWLESSPEAVVKTQRRLMGLDWSWDRAAREYALMYERLARRARPQDVQPSAREPIHTPTSPE